MTLLALAQRAPLQPVRLEGCEQRGIELALWRLDRIDAAAPGNKLFKLSENLQAARAAGQQRVLSFGGAFSNHIHALALTGAAQGLQTIGLIRGEPDARDNPTLRDAAAAGMQLHFLSRHDYRRLSSVADGAAHAELQARFGPCHIVPEGGSNRLGVLGCRVLGEAIAAFSPLPDLVILPCATGATLAGVVAGLADRSEVHGIAVLKGGEFLRDAVREQLESVAAGHCRRWRIDTDDHCGGYARVPLQLQQFVARFERATEVPIEPVYTGKMLYAIHRRIERGDYARGTRILALHTGGLQGARGFSYRRERTGSTATGRMAH